MTDFPPVVRQLIREVERTFSARQGIRPYVCALIGMKLQRQDVDAWLDDKHRHRIEKLMVLLASLKDCKAVGMVSEGWRVAVDYDSRSEALALAHELKLQDHAARVEVVNISIDTPEKNYLCHAEIRRQASIRPRLGPWDYFVSTVEDQPDPSEWARFMFSFHKVHKVQK